MIDRRGPEWDCTAKEWMLWQWQATMHLNGKGYKATLEGDAMVADVLTKPLDARRYASLRDAMMGRRGQP